jgi:hypothetical protein
MAEISKPTFGTATLPFPSEAIITPMWTSSENITLGGKSRRDVMSRKYQYTLRWDYMSVRDYDTLEIVVNTLIAQTFIYDKWPQSTTPGITCLGSLSARKLEAGVGSVHYWSSITLTLTEVDSRI